MNSEQTKQTKQTILQIEFQMDILIDERRSLEQEIDLYEEDYSGYEQDRINSISRELDDLHIQYETLTGDL